MKNQLITIIFAMVLASTAFAGNPVIGTVSYSPAPAMPGGYIDIFVHINNNSNADSKDTVFAIDLKQDDSNSEFPFNVIPETIEIKKIGTIKPNQSSIVKSRIKIDPQAPDGVYKIKLQTGENGIITRSTPYSISIQNRKPLLIIEKAEPTSVEVGKITDLVISLKNTGSSTAYNINIGITEDRTVTSSGIVIERNIVPMGSATSNVQLLEPNESKEIKIPVLINPDAQSKAYFIPIKIDYFDFNKTKLSDTQYLGIKVLSNAEIGASIVDIKPLLSPGQKSTITINIFNSGLGTAKYLDIKAKPDFDSMITEEFYIGSLESDDSDTIKMDVMTNKNISPGEHNINLQITYKNQFGDVSKTEKTLKVKVYTPEEAAKNSSGGLPILPIAIVLVVSALGYWFVIRKKKNNE
jgi:hypothetical protein